MNNPNRRKSLAERGMADKGLKLGLTQEEADFDAFRRARVKAIMKGGVLATGLGIAGMLKPKPNSVPNFVPNFVGANMLIPGGLSAALTAATINHAIKKGGRSVAEFRQKNPESKFTYNEILDHLYE